MLDHVSIGVTDLVAAERFYDAVMDALGVPKIGRSADWLGYGERCSHSEPGRTYLSVRPMAEAQPSFARHWCFKAPSRAAVDAFWVQGIAHGGVDDGAPGVRSSYHPCYYAAFLLDPCGNRVEAVCHRAPIS